MKNLLFTLHLLLLFLIFQINAYAQFDCSSNVSISLDENGSAYVIPAILLENGDPAEALVSIDNINFHDTIPLDCSNIGTTEVFVKNSVTQENCSSFVTIEDKLAPLPYCLNLFTVYGQFGPADEGIPFWAFNGVLTSIDNCTTTDKVRYTFGLNPDQDPSYVDSIRSSVTEISPWEYAQGNITRDIWVWDESGNGDFCTVSINVQLTTNSLACNAEVNISLDPNGEVVVSPDMILEGTLPTNLVISKDDINFFPTISFDCDEIGTTEVVVKDSDTGNRCWSNLTISDNLQPFLDLKNFSHDFTTESETITINASDIIVTSYDNCSYTIDISQTEFDVYDLGHNEVYVTVTDAAGNITNATTDVYLTLNGDPFATICHPELEIYTNAWNCNIEQLMASSVYVGHAIHDSSTVSLDNIVFVETITNISQDPGSQFVVYVQKIEDGDTTYCSSIVSIVDITPPVASVLQNISISLTSSSTSSAGIAKLVNNSLNSGSHDACSDIFIEVRRDQDPCGFHGNTTYNNDGHPQDGSDDPNSPDYDPDGGQYVKFCCADLTDVDADGVHYGIVKVWMRVWDLNGNFNETWTNVRVEDKLPPTIQCPADITITCNSNPLDLSLTGRAISFTTCGNASITYNDIVSNISNCGEGYIIRRWSIANSVFCDQRIDITAGTPFDGNITWPNDIDTINCQNNGEPSWPPAQCGLLGYSNTVDTTIATNGEVTYLIHWVVIDWCSYEADFPTNDPNNNGIQDGIWRHDQTVIINDIIPPVAIVDLNNYLSLNYTSQDTLATLNAESLDDGSYDYCSDITFLIDLFPSNGIGDAVESITFGIEDLGEHQVVLYVIDASGNVSTAITNLTIYDDGFCNFTIVSLPQTIIEIPNTTNPDISPEVLISDYNFTKEQVQPTWPSICNGIIATYTDQKIVISPNQFKVIRIWTILNWYTLESVEHFQIIKTVAPDILVCKNNVTIPAYEDELQLYVEDFVVSPENTEFLSLSVYDENNVIIEDNLLLAEHLVQSLTFVVTQTQNNNSCTGTIIILVAQGCAFDESNIDWPNDVIFIETPGIDPGTLTVDELMTTYGFQETEVDVILTSEPCNIVAKSFTNEVFILPNGYFKILRKFTVIDWTAFQAGSTTGIWTFTQLIKNIVEPNSLICDILPRGAAVGTCTDGHTLDDEVEWPNDLNISDYHIKPQDLITYSNVDPLDAIPSFYYPENIVKYDYQYNDLFIGLTSTTLELARVWTVTHLQYGITWNYSQSILINFTDFQNLVTVRTEQGRAVPNVLFNGTELTDDKGQVLLSENNVNSILYEDQILNGINILDLILIEKHILKLKEFNANLAHTADVNNDGVVNASDLVLLRQIIIGKVTSYPNYNGIWQFKNNLEDITLEIKPLGEYAIFKPGDVDDSAILYGEEISDPVNSFHYDDILLNKGQTYAVPVYLEKEIISNGLEFRIQLDLDKVQINTITSNIDNNFILYHVNDEGLLTITLTSSAYEDFTVGGESSTEIFTLDITAKDNSVLGEAITTEDLISYAADNNFQLIVIDGNITNSINAVWDEALSGLSVYPNPATEFLTIDVSNIEEKGQINVSIYESNGRKVLSQVGKHINLSSLNTGLYLYQVEINGFKYTDKLNIIK